MPALPHPCAHEQMSGDLWAFPGHCRYLWGQLQLWGHPCLPPGSHSVLHRGHCAPSPNCCRRAERAAGCYLGIQSILSPALCRAAQARALLQEQHLPVAEVLLCRGSWLTECSDVTSYPQHGGRLHKYQNHLMHWPKPNFLTLPLHKNRSDPLVTTRI